MQYNLSTNKVIKRECKFSFNSDAQKKEIDEDGCLVQYDVPIARIGEFIYRAFEFGFIDTDNIDPNKLIRVYRDESSFNQEILAKNLDIPFTNNHPDGPVNVSNARYIRVGSVNGLYFENGILYAKQIKIYEQDTINDIESGGKKEVSIGFEASYDMRPILINNKQYDGLEQVVRINHLSLVDEGKAGPDFKMHHNKLENEKMSTNAQAVIEVDGVKLEVSQEQALALNAAQAQKRDLETNKMFSEITNTLKKLSENLGDVVKLVNAKNEDDEDKEEKKENKKNEDEEEEKKENKKNEDECKEDKENDEDKEDKENSIEESAGKLTANAHLKNEMASLYQSNQVNNSSYFSKAPNLAYNSVEFLEKDFIKTQDPSFSELVASIRNVYCA